MARALDTSVDSGALIALVEPGSAAEQAELHVGDIIVEINGEKITGASELRNAIGLMGSGEKVKIRYVREGKTRSATAVLGQQQVTRSTGSDIHPGLEGAEFAAAAASSAGGIEVTGVEPDSPAAQRGLRAGDVITAVNRRPVRNLEQLTEIARANSILFLLVQRGDRTLMLQIR